VCVCVCVIDVGPTCGICVCVLCYTCVCVCMYDSHTCVCIHDIHMCVCVCMNPQGLNVEQVRNREVARQRRLAASGSHSDVIPAVCVCVEGGVGTIRTVHAAVTRGTPVVVVKVRVAVCCSVLQCVAVRCSVLQCVAVCCSVHIAVTCSTPVVVVKVHTLCVSVS